MAKNPPGGIFVYHLRYTALYNILEGNIRLDVALQEAVDGYVGPFTELCKAIQGPLKGYIRSLKGLYKHKRPFRKIRNENCYESHQNVLYHQTNSKYHPKCLFAMI